MVVLGPGVSLNSGNSTVSVNLPGWRPVLESLLVLLQ